MQYAVDSTNSTNFKSTLDQKLRNLNQVKYYQVKFFMVSSLYGDASYIYDG